MIRAATAISSAILIAGSAGLAQAEPVKFELQLVDHLRAEMIEQDVYVERTAGSGEVYRVTTEDAAAFNDSPVFTTATEVSHDPMNAAANGPHQKGQALGFTLGEWLNASGTVNYTCEDGTATIEATFDNLVPEGVYTMWSFYLPTPFAEPFTTYDLPMGSRDGSDSIFIADRQGNARYDVSFEPCLQGGADQLAAGIAIAYHSDGQTYGAVPGEFGNKTHVHLFALLPPQSEIVVAAR